MALNAKYTKGIEIEIGGNSTKLKTALDEANRVIRTSQSELRTLQNSLKLEWNADNFKRAQELSQRALEQTEQKAETLRKALAALEAEGKGQGTEQYEAIRRELSYVEVAAQKARKQLEELNNADLEKLIASFGDAGERLDAMGGKLTAGVTLPLAAAGTAAYKYASDTEESLNKVEVAFGGASDAVKSWSETTLTSIGLARGTSLDMAALFGDMATSMGLSREEAAQMSMALVDLSGDLASFKNASIDQVQTALKSIFTGETESLKELGVVMTQANLQAYALAKGYQTAYTAMDQAQQVAVRYQYVLDNTQNAQGDFARTSDSAANQVRILQESLKEAAAAAGEELLPVITPIITNLAELVQSFGDLDEGTRKAVVQVGLFAAALGPSLKLTGGLTSAVTAGITAYQALTAATTTAAAAQTGLNAAMSANPVGAVVTAVGALVAVLGSMALSAALTAEKQEDLNQKLHETVEAGQQAVEQVREDTAAKQANLEMVRSLLPEIEALNEKTARTQTEQSKLNGLVSLANELYPDLIGQVDALTGSYDVNRAAIEGTIDAMAHQLELEALQDVAAEKYRTMAELKLQLAEAEEAWAEAQERAAQAQSAMESSDESGYEAATMAYHLARDEAAQYGETVALLQENIASLEEETRSLLSTTGAAGDAFDAMAASAAGAASAVSAQAQGVEGLRGRLEAYLSAMNSAQGAYQLLTSAQEEMNESGALSVDTLTAMVEQYPDLLGYLEETEAGYRLTQGALEDYIASQRSAYTLALTSAQDAADAIVAAEADKLRSISATTLSAKEQLIALANLYQAMAVNTDNQAEGGSYFRIAAEYRQAAQEIQDAEEVLANFDRVVSSLGRSTASGRVSSTGTSSAGSTRTDAFQEALEELQYLRDMDEVDEAGYYARLEALRDQYLDANSEKWRSVTVELHQWKKERSQAAYDEELADQKYFLDMEIISEEEYYAALASLRDRYLEENSDAWRQANVALHNYQQQCREEELAAAKAAYEARLDALKSAYEDQKDAAKDAYEAQKEAAREAYEEKKAQIQKELALEKERLNAIIDGINQEIQARRELREDEDLDAAIAAAQKRLDAARAQLAYARTDEDRAEWEKEIVRLEEALQEAVQNKEDTEFYRQKEAEKEAVQDQIQAAEEKAEAELDAAEAEYEATLQQLQAEYEETLSRLEQEYQSAVDALGKDKEVSGGGREYSEEVRGIAKEQGVDLGVAYSMWLANQRNDAKPGDDYYYAGGEVTKAAQAAQSAAQAAAAVVGAVAGAVTNVRNNSASVVIQQAASLTEGQVARTVEKVLEKLGR